MTVLGEMRRLVKARKSVRVRLQKEALSDLFNCFFILNHRPIGQVKYVFVKSSNGSITYAACGPNRTGSLSLQRYSQDKKAYQDYFKEGMPNERTKSVFKIQVPEGMSSEEFDNKVKETINSYGNNPDIQYSLDPEEETEGNCNTSTSTILSKPGVSSEEIESIENDIPGINWGFSSTSKPWTKEEQQKAIELHQQKIKEKINQQEALQKAL